jgi:hypothetical protein
MLPPPRDGRGNGRRLALKRVHMAWLGTAWLLGALSGCRQGENDTCQVDGDCQSALKCCIATNSARGHCYEPANEACMPIAPSTNDEDAGK